MAVKSKSSLRRASLIALAIGALSLPAMAQAAPEERGTWRQRVAREDAPRPERPDRPERPVQQTAPQAEQAPRQQQPTRNWSPPPQAQGAVHAAPQSRWNGGEGRRASDQSRRQGWTAQNAAAEPARATQQAVPARSGWRDRVGRADDREQRIRNAAWRNRNGQSGTWQDRTAETEHVAPRGVTTQGRDWRSRVQRSDSDRSENRDYWRRRDWSSHWDHSRRHNWSGWNNHWNWNWGHDYRRWDTRWRGSSRYDWYGWRNRYPSYFQVGLYYSPYRNYSYRRLGIGYFLDSLFFDQDYWIADPQYYRLPEAYGPYRWVRYYDDAVLVNIYSGEVADVVYRFFW